MLASFYHYGILAISFISFYMPCSYSQEADHFSPKDKHIMAIGTLSPIYKSTLGSLVSGRVDELFVDVGERVKKGQALLKLDQTLFKIALEEAVDAERSASIELDDAKKNFDRMKKLFTKADGHPPSISQKRFEDAETRFEQAKVSKERAKQNVKKAQTNLDETTIKAPYDGVITKRLVHPGEAVNATPVTKTVEMLFIDRLYVEFSLPQIYRSRLHLKDPIEIQIEGLSSEKIPSIIDLIYPDIDEKTRSIKCRATLENPSGNLQPGALVRVLLPAKEIPNASL